MTCVRTLWFVTQMSCCHVCVSPLSPVGAPVSNQGPLLHMTERNTRPYPVASPLVGDALSLVDATPPRVDDVTV